MKNGAEGLCVIASRADAGVAQVITLELADRGLRAAMEDMPEARVRQVLAGQLAQAARQDLAPLSTAVARAGSLSTALAAELNQTAPGGPPAQPRLAAYYADRVATPHAAAQAASDARYVQQALAATRSPFGAGHHRGYSPDR